MLIISILKMKAIYAILALIAAFNLAACTPKKAPGIIPPTPTLTAPTYGHWDNKTMTSCIYTWCF